jgi:hypothetical protein
MEVDNNVFRPVSDNHKEASFPFLDAIANQCRNPGVSALNSVSLLQLLREGIDVFWAVYLMPFNIANTDSV